MSRSSTPVLAQALVQVQALGRVQVAEQVRVPAAVQVRVQALGRVQAAMGVWYCHLRHSKAYTTLTTDAAKRVAKEAGVKGDPQKAAECLVCHVTAYSTPASHKASSLTMEEGVSCEACHGPGSEYKSVKVMKGVFKGIMKGVDYGLVKPDVTSCKKCHNAKSPTYKPFKFEAALKIIAHPTPKN